MLAYSRACLIRETLSAWRHFRWFRRELLFVLQRRPPGGAVSFRRARTGNSVRSSRDDGVVLAWICSRSSSRTTLRLSSAWSMGTGVRPSLQSVKTAPGPLRQVYPGTAAMARGSICASLYRSGTFPERSGFRALRAPICCHRSRFRLGEREATPNPLGHDRDL